MLFHFFKKDGLIYSCCMVHGLHVSEEMFAAAIFDSILYIQLSSNICKYNIYIYIYLYYLY